MIDRSGELEPEAVMDGLAVSLCIYPLAHLRGSNGLHICSANRYFARLVVIRMFRTLKNRNRRRVEFVGH